MGTRGQGSLRGGVQAGIFPSMGSCGARGTVRRWGRASVGLAAFFLLANCASDKFARRVDPRYGVSTSARVIEPGEPVPKGGGVYRVGKPYIVAGQTYVPEENTHYSAEGMASWYGDDFHGRLTANGEVFDMNAISAAHPTLPMPCYVRVTNLANRRSLVVRVNDRGPYHQNRVIDLSVRAAQLLGFHGDGVTRVRVEYVGTAPLEGSEDRLLLATLRDGEPAPAPSLVMVASAKPFFPQIKEPSPAFRGSVPVPQGRPFALGERPSAPDIAASPMPPPTDPAQPPSRSSVAVSAFAPARVDSVLSTGMPPSVISGRGLY
jgi:rare lipoprotein A